MAYSNNNSHRNMKRRRTDKDVTEVDVLKIELNKNDIIEEDTLQIPEYLSLEESPESVNFIDEDIDCYNRTFEGNIDNESVTSQLCKDEVLKEQLRALVIKKHLTVDVTNDILKILKNYGCKLPENYNQLIIRQQKIDNNILTNSIATQNLRIDKLENKVEHIDKMLTKFVVQQKREISRLKGNQSKSVNRISNSTSISFSGNEACDRPDIDLPITTKEDLDILEEECKTKNLIEYFSFYKDKPIVTIFDRQLLLSYNWNGSKGKESFKAYMAINRTLSEAFKSGEIQTYEDYVQHIVKLIRLSHNSYHSQTFRSRRALTKVITNLIKPEQKNQLNSI